MSIKHKINYVVDACHWASRNAGWWTEKDGTDATADPKTFAVKLMLIVSELAEAMEADRKDLMDDKLPHRNGTEVELADAVIRICDLAGAYNMDLGGAMEEKMAFNRVRPDHKKEAREAVGGKAY
jgi:NTP pyrophosphatase (non-canonical NTP hydrolase)